MKKNEFIAECAQKSGLTKKDTREVLDIFFSVIVDHMKDEDGISPYTVIKFHANYKEAYEGHMPGSGEKIMVPGMYMPKVKFSKKLRDTINILK